MPEPRPWSLPQQVTLDMGRLLFKLLFRLRVEGAGHLPETGGAIVVCNHPTLFDPILLTLALPRQACPLAEITPWKYDSVAYFLDLFGVIPMEKEHATAALRQCLDVLADGRLLVVFPEGNLSIAGKMRPFHPGAVKLALDSGCPIVPTAVCGSYHAWPKERKVPRLAPVTVRFGAPLDLGRAAGRRQSAKLLRGLTHDVREAVDRLYTPWDPRLAPADAAMGSR